MLMYDAFFNPDVQMNIRNSEMHAPNIRNISKHPIINQHLIGLGFPSVIPYIKAPFAMNLQIEIKPSEISTHWSPLLT